MHILQTRFPYGYFTHLFGWFEILVVESVCPAPLACIKQTHRLTRKITHLWPVFY